jgi:hypothetical protein
MINCGDRPMGPAVDVRISVNGHDIQNDKINRFVGFRIGAREGSLTYNENGRLDTFCLACISNYEIFWEMARSGKSVLFEMPDGMQTEFSLDGTSKVLPKKSCVSEVELAMHPPIGSAETSVSANHWKRGSENGGMLDSGIPLTVQSIHGSTGIARRHYSPVFRYPSGISSPSLGGSPPVLAISFSNLTESAQAARDAK